MKHELKFLAALLIATAGFALMACGGGSGGGGSEGAADTPEQSFAAFKDALAKNDTQAALDQVTSAYQQRVSDMIDAAQAQGFSPADMAAGLGKLKLEQNRKTFKVYSVTKKIKGQSYAFEVIYMREDGQWRILSI